nr:hypothetical protein [Paenibacillus allorhizosphaerae]
MRISLLTMLVLVVYLPVNNDALYGAHTGCPEIAFEKLRLSVASLSILCCVMA